MPPMRSYSESEASQRPATTVELELGGEAVIHFRREAARRDISVPRLIHGSPGGTGAGSSRSVTAIGAN
jgi:hypothetical protein